MVAPFLSGRSRCDDLCMPAGTAYARLERSAQNAPQGLGGFPHHDIHLIASFPYRLQQAQPHAISRTATRNISAPYREDRRDQDPGPQRHRTDAQYPACRRLSETYAPRPFLTTSIYVTACPGAEGSAHKKRPGMARRLRRLLFRLLPVLQRLELLIEAHIAVRGGSAGSCRCAPPPARRSPSPWCGCTPQSGTGPDKAANSRKVSGRWCLQLQIQLVGLEGGKARGVHHIRPAGQVVAAPRAGWYGVPGPAPG